MIRSDCVLLSSHLPEVDIILIYLVWMRKLRLENFPKLQARKC